MYLHASKICTKFCGTNQILKVKKKIQSSPFFFRDKISSRGQKYEIGRIIAISGGGVLSAKKGGGGADGNFPLF